MKALETSETLEGTQAPEPPKTLDKNPARASSNPGGGASVVEDETSGDAGNGAVLVESRSYTSTESVEEVSFELSQNGSGVVPSGKVEEGAVAVRTFAAGDFVWGKAKRHLWWPGQVYDLSDASESAEKEHRKDRHCVLAAYFGDGTFAWCDPSQLKPFTTGFEELVRQSSGKSFVGAVRAALDELGRCLELEMTCRCVPAEVLHRLSRPLVVNAGIKEGAAASNGRTGELSIVGGVPSELLKRFRDIACDISATNVLEATVVRSWVSAFYGGKGWYASLPEYHLYKVTVEIEEKGNCGAPHLGLNVNEPAEEEESLSAQKTSSGLGKGPEIVDDKWDEGKKQRSMAELIAEMDLDMEEEGGNEEEVAVPDKPASPIWKRKEKVVEGKTSNAETGEAASEEGTSSGRRERKKSKYLSPPYTMIGATTPKSLEKKTSKKDLENSHDVDSESKMAGIGSPPILKCNGSMLRDKKGFVLENNSSSVDEMLSELRYTALNPLYLVGNRYDPIVRGFFGRYRSSVYTNGSGFEDYGKSLSSPIVTIMKTPVCVTNGTHEDRPSGVAEEKTPVQGHGSSEGRSGSGMKRKSPGLELNTSQGTKLRGTPQKKSVVHGVNGFQEAKSASSGKTISVGQNANGSEENKPKKKRKKKKEGANVETGASLLLSFEKGVVLPSKENLVSTFSKFGVLNESNTEMLKDTGCASVEFARRTDAENAFNSSQRDGPFGSGVATCRLQYLQGNSSTPLQSVPKPPLEFVKKSLESMIATLTECSLPRKDVESAGELRMEARENLVDEMNGLLKKVNKLLTDTSSSAAAAGAST